LSEKIVIITRHNWRPIAMDFQQRICQDFARADKVAARRSAPSPGETDIT
jgi:hypothetical protein